MIIRARKKIIITAKAEAITEKILKNFHLPSPSSIKFKVSSLFYLLEKDRHKDWQI